jgi:NAD(P)H-nitrite reductase large subunit
MKNTEAIKILPKNKEIKLTNGKKIKFDKLLITTGAKPIIPKGMNGLELGGVHIMGTLDSTIGIIDNLNQGVKHAVVLGGGFMGIETAIMLTKKEIKVSVVEMLPHILSRMLDPDISNKMTEILKNHGIKLILNDSVKNINGEKKVTDVYLNKNKLRCDMVVIAIGVRPNIELVKDSGIKINKGIIVDSTMQTNIKDIYAAGDIAEVRDQIEGKLGSFAIWPNAIEQGRIAGSNMANKKIIYNGAEVVNVLDVFDTPIVTMGQTSKEIGKCKVVTRNTPTSSKKILLKNNKIVGLQFIGTIQNAGVFYSLMKKGSDVSGILDRMLDDNFVIAPDIIF